MAEYRAPTSSCSRSTQAPLSFSVPHLAQRLEALTTSDEISNFFAGRLDSVEIGRLGRSVDGRKILLGLLQAKAEAYFRDHLAPEFWNDRFEALVNSSSGGHALSLDTFLNVYFEKTVMVVQFFISVLEKLSVLPQCEVQMETYRIRDLIIHAQQRLMQHHKPLFTGMVIRFYKKQLLQLIPPNLERSHVEEGPSPILCVKQVRDALEYLELSEIHQIALKTVVLLLLKNRLAHLAQTSEMDSWREVYNELRDYALDIKLKFLHHMVDEQAIPEWEDMLMACLGRAVGMQRMEQLYEMASDFPDSLYAVQDMRVSLKLGHVQEAELVESFTEQITKRLLQAGASTQDIILHFLKASKMFAEIDPCGSVMETVNETYKEYLRDRIDTMKCIVSVLADTKQSKPCVLEEMAGVQPDAFEEEGCTLQQLLLACQRRVYLDEDISLLALTEMRNILERATRVPVPERKNDTVYDVVSTLLGIYSSQEQFTEEYQKLLAEQLIMRTDFRHDREMRVFRLLKKRFDDPKLSDCEVMLNDIVQSKVTNPALQEETDKILRKEARDNGTPDVILPRISATLMSYLYWPEQREPQIQFPEEIQRAFGRYTEKYEEFKAPRKLKWRTGVGVVELDVKIGNAPSRRFTVDPILATLLLKFTADEARKEEDLATEIGLPVPVLKSRIAFWINNSVLWERVENGEIWYRRRSQMDDPGAAIVEESDDEIMESSEARESDAGKFACFRMYILEFLRHRGDMHTTLDEIHRHLEKFVKQHTFDMSQMELAEYLDTLTMERAIRSTNGVYKIRN